MEVDFDGAKAASNLRKHGISFEEATSCLFDPQALVREDIHALGENRLVLLGMSVRGRLLVVVYTVRGEVVRLISARRATRNEGTHYAKRI